MATPTPTQVLQARAAIQGLPANAAGLSSALMAVALLSDDPALVQTSIDHALQAGLTVEELATAAFERQRPLVLAHLQQAHGLDLTHCVATEVPLDWDLKDESFSRILQFNPSLATAQLTRARNHQYAFGKRHVEAQMGATLLTPTRSLHQVEPLMAQLWATPSAPGAPWAGESLRLPPTPEGIYPLALALSRGALDQATWLVEHLGWPASMEGLSQCLTGAVERWQAEADDLLRAQRGLPPHDRTFARTAMDAEDRWDTWIGWMDGLVAQGARWTHRFAAPVRLYREEPEDVMDEAARDDTMYLNNDEWRPGLVLTRSWATLMDDPAVLTHTRRWAQQAAAEPPAPQSQPWWLSLMTADQFEWTQTRTAQLEAALATAMPVKPRGVAHVYAEFLAMDLEDGRYYHGERMRALIATPPPGMDPLTPELARAILAEATDALDAFFAHAPVVSETFSLDPEGPTHPWAHLLNDLSDWALRWDPTGDHPTSNEWREAIEGWSDTVFAGLREGQSEAEQAASRAAVSTHLALLSTATTPTPTRRPRL